MNGNYIIMCIIILDLMMVSFSLKKKKSHQQAHVEAMCLFTYSLMAILSEFRDDTDDML